MRKQERDSGCDPSLAALANQLQYVYFEITDEQRYQLTGDLHNVALFQDMKTYRVRCYLGGKQRVIGITDNIVKAARFADMARLYFWKYRIRDVRPPVDTDLNFSLAQAEEDAATNFDAAELLRRIESLLSESGALKLASAIPGKDARRTVRGDLLNLSADLGSRLDANLAASKHDYDEIKLAFRHLNDTMTKLAEVVQRHLTPEQAVNRDAIFGEHLFRADSVPSPNEPEDQDTV